MTILSLPKALGQSGLIEKITIATNSCKSVETSKKNRENRFRRRVYGDNTRGVLKWSVFTYKSSAFEGLANAKEADVVRSC